MYRISSYKILGFYFLPSIFDPACKRIGPLFGTGRLFRISFCTDFAQARDMDHVVFIAQSEVCNTLYNVWQCPVW